MAQENGAVTEIHPSLDTAWWWAALERGELLIPACHTCDRRFFPPQAYCPHCGSGDLYGAATSGAGKVYSWVVIHRAFGPTSGEVPYAIVAVDIDDGGRLIGRYVGDLDVIRDALPVAAQVITNNGAQVLGFGPALGT